MSTSLPLFADCAAEVLPGFEASLDRFASFEAGCPLRLAEAVRYSLLAPGKRLRPLLALFAAQACGGSRALALPAACAVEMVHCYSLIHDDLPAMDDDDLRRGRPTCHRVFGEGLAILAGDALLARAFEVLASELPPSQAASACRLLGRAAGAAALVGGQADDLAGEFTNQGLDALESIHARKTGAMLHASLALGGITAEASPDQHECLNRYGQTLGLAFQIADDLLDVRGDQAILGKRAQKDAGRGKLTFPGVLGVEESSRRATGLIAQSLAAIADWGAAADPLRALARYVLERDH